jgi:hypothetical protein
MTVAGALQKVRNASWLVVVIVAALVLGLLDAVIHADAGIQEWHDDGHRPFQGHGEGPPRGRT